MKSDIQLSHIQFEYLREAWRHTRDLGADFYFCTYPSAHCVRNPSVVERVLRRVQFSEAPTQPDAIAVGHRVLWLAGNPGHFKYIYGKLPYYDATYIRNIFSGPSSYLDSGGLVMHPDFRSRFVNVEGGFRRTVNQPEEAVHAVHVFGSSVVYGFGSEDRHTIPSFLQWLLSSMHKAEGVAPSVVYNYGIRGGTCQIQNAHVLGADIRPGDTVLYFESRLDCPRELFQRYTVHKTLPDALANLCTANGIPVVDSRPMFDRPHAHGEVFFDANHLAFRGNMAIARCIYHRCFLAEHKRRQASTAVRAAMDEFWPHVEPADPWAENEQLLAYLESLRPHAVQGGVNGAIVMNCNPFTLGHQHLIRTAAAKVDRLYVFVVQEDRSTFPYEERLAMVRAGCRGFENVTVLPGGQFIISALTFPEYFTKDDLKDISIDATNDLTVFARHVAQALNITVRFAGEEPFCPITRQYNEQMRRLLPAYGIAFEVIARHEILGTPVSASMVRRLMEEKRYADIGNFVPQTTLEHLVASGRVPPLGEAGAQSAGPALQ